MQTRRKTKDKVHRDLRCSAIKDATTGKMTFFTNSIAEKAWLFIVRVFDKLAEALCRRESTPTEFGPNPEGAAMMKEAKEGGEAPLQTGPCPDWS